ncbi:MAG: hypothetical protein FWH07_03605 [Oscillospiraceae bacterium]|nr:hypothetical protein [Oscillospiraceae bacterium]
MGEIMKKGTAKLLTIFSLILLALLIFTFVLLFVQPFSKTSINERAFKKSITLLSNEVIEIKLNELTPFDWDYAYSFGPYTSIEKMEEVIGFKSNKLYTMPSEGMSQIMFVYDNEVICNIIGYPGKYPGEVGFSFDFGEQNELIKTNNPNFSVDIRNGIKYFTLN